jgi:hypothetical protein
MDRPTSIGIGYAIRKDAEKRIKPPWLAYGNYPYNIGHACVRYLVLCRTRGDERARIDAGTRLLFDEGKNVVEPDVTRRLEAMGYEVHARQSRLKKEMKEKYNISGMVDVELLVPPQIQHDLGLPPCGPPPEEGGSKKANYLVPGEIKGMSDNNYKYLTTAENMMDAMINAPAGQWYMRQYAAQILCYIWGLDKPYGVFIIKNKLTGAITDRIVYYDEHLEYFEGILQRCKHIEECVHRGELPPPIDEWIVCARCDARHLCMPDRTPEDRIALINGMEPLLEKRDELLSTKRPIEQELKSINEEVKRRLEAVPDEKDTALAGVWQCKRKKGGGWTYKRLHGEEVME